ncbi:hypothetical protein GGF39_000950 [Coemansia sp. RSA 1721]|nr:hypothetical protein GGF39_000950 [Coemansia sp. RSA 1721]
MAPSKLSNDARKKLAANLQVLRRYDEQIEAIVDTTSHVVLYQFQEATQSWANKAVEGALFIYKRASAPYYGFTILNRVGLDNYTELLSADMTFQTSDQIVIYTSKSGNGIVGIWIYEEADRIRVPEQLSMCCKSSESAFAGQGPQCLYPKNKEEQKEFMRMYPRSRSNSKRDPGSDGSGSNALSTIINRTRQQQRKSSQSAAKNDTAGANDLVSKLQAIGLDPSGLSGAQSQQTKENADTLQLDPAIIMARKSVKPHEMQQVATSNAGNGGHGQAPVQMQMQTQGHANGSAESSSAFKSPISVPAVHAYSQGGSSVPVATPASPVLHPVASPFPPSTIATPLPGQCPPGVDPNLAYMAQAQQFWHPQMGNPSVPRSAHASPAPMGFGMIPGMHSFPQLPMGHPGAAHTPQPGMSMTPVQFISGMYMQRPPSMAPSSQPGNAAAQPSAENVVPAASSAHVLAQGAVSNTAPMVSPSGNPSMAQSLAEQLVSLVRQRMSSVQQHGGSGVQPVSTSAPVPAASNGTAGGAPQQPAAVSALPPNAVKMQRDYCREWLIRVIQADDELVDAFAQRFPPPIFPQNPNGQKGVPGS